MELYIQEEEKEPENKKRIRNYDGILVQKVWNEKRNKFRDRPYYALVFGHHLFLFDGPFYRKYKRELLEETKKNMENKKDNWLYVTAGILFQQRKMPLSRNKLFESAPVLNHKKSPTLSLPDPLKLFNSHYMIDLQHQVVRAQVSTDSLQQSCFEIELTSKQILYYKAPNTQIMLQWINIINHSISLDRFLLFDSLSYKKPTILVSSDLYRCTMHNTYIFI